MAPEIPVAAETFGSGKRAEVAVVGLALDQLRDETSQMIAQRRRVGQRQCLDGGDEIFVSELARPRHELRRRLAVARAEHLDHPRIGSRRAQQPLIDIHGEPPADNAPDLPLGLRRQ